MAYETLLYDVDGEIGTLTLNRPKKVNAFNRKMVDELIEFWRDRQEDSVVRVIVMRGAGEKGFCSGVDLKDWKNLGPNPEEKEFSPYTLHNAQMRFSSICRLMRSCPQPVIAAVHGPAMGGGLSFTLAADVRLASEDAMFCAQYVNIGLGGADMGSSYFLWRIIGSGRAAEMCLTGARVYADEAYRIGLVNHIYPGDELMPAALDMAKNMVSKSKLGLRLTKEALNAGLNLSSLEDANVIEDRNQAYMIAVGLMNTEIKRS
ncbi:MAG: enoyl-CoA hydratase/isomerase family protein [Desulfobacteraceae bacterium]|nr:MAG: enoyl-CoA hydratase/isomerase family protein [Desulfobacteraceae bacterium]